MILLNMAGLARPVRIAGEVLLGDLDGLLHLLLGLEEGLVDHGCSSVSVLRVGRVVRGPSAPRRR